MRSNIAGRRGRPTLPRDRHRICTDECRCHCHGGKRGAPSKTSNLDHPDRVRDSKRSSRYWPGRKSARPVGNATGLSIQSSDLAGKRLELLREVTPGLRRLAILTNVDYAGAVLEAGEVQDAADTLGLEVVILEIRRAEDIAPALDRLRGRAQGLYLPSEAIVFTNRALIATLAQDVRLVDLQL